MKSTPPNRHRVKRGTLGSNDHDGMNGFFIFKREYPSSATQYEIRCMVSDGETTGWEHVSVSLDRKRCPTWEEMCFVKDSFWNKNETVMQFHPDEGSYINNHLYCLHLWRKVGEDTVLPPSILVGV